MVTENGAFRKRQSFTQVSNALVRDTNISAKAKGIYLVIMSYVTMEEFTLTKGFLVKQFSDGTKAFNSGWNELKDAGYLKVYNQPAKDGMSIEYELLDEPKAGPHTFYLNANGDISSTNLTRNQGGPERHPQKGSDAKRVPAEGVPANGSDIIILNNNITPLTPQEPAQEPAAKSGRKPQDAEGRARLESWVCQTYEGRAQEVILQALMDFADLRAKMRKPILTVRTADGLIRDLLKHSGGGNPRMVKLVIDNSIKRNWMTFYALKDDMLPQAPPGQRVEQEVVAQW